MKLKLDHHAFFDKKSMSKLYLIMRLTFILFVIGLLQVSAASFSQKKNISISSQEIELSDLFEEVEKKSDYKFFFNNDDVDASVLTSVSASNADVYSVLDEALKGLPYEYKVLDNNLIFVHRRNEAKSSTQQSVNVTGVVTDEIGEPLPGVNVFEKSAPTNGVITGIDGTYTLSISNADAVVVFSYIGFEKQEVNVAGRSSVNVTLVSDTEDLDEVVVTALGIKRDEKSLGYAVTKVGGEELMKGNSDNVTSALSGRVSGVNIISSGNIGGSTNVVIRGGSSIDGNNQALYVIDGVPISNASVNNSTTQRGAGGYDYGNLAADINPEDIENVSVLKGASATALYGSRGSNGVILITTKKGRKQNGVGVTINSSVEFQQINTATLPDYQKEYGGGYHGYTVTRDGFSNWYGQTFQDGFVTNADGLRIVDYGTDESWGPKFDPNIDVVHWDGIDQNGMITETRPWVAPKAGPEGYFDTGIVFRNSVSLSGSGESSSFRVSYTNVDNTGVVPESKEVKNVLNMNTTYNLTDKFSTTVTGSFTKTNTKNRPKTGYDWQDGNSFMASAGMWMQTNVDYDRLENYKYANGVQRTWNRSSLSDPTPNYWNNPYWTVNENYPEDDRNRIVGSWSINYDITNWLKAMGRVSVDHNDWSIYSRQANGSKGTSYYNEYRRIASEYNYDFYLNVNKTFGNFNLTAMLGTAQRDNSSRSTYVSTTDGLAVDDLYTIKNSRSAEIYYSPGYLETTVRSVFGTASLGWNNEYYVEVTARNDWSSTLPEGQNSYFYPSITGSWIFTERMDWAPLTYGKLRANYAEVGNDAGFARLQNTYYNYGNHGGNEVYRYGVSTTKLNPDLKPETLKSYELGIDTKWYNNRIGLNFSYYNKKAIDQIIAGSISIGTGYYSQYMNLGEREIQGYEVDLYITPVKTNNFVWDMSVNWSTFTDQINSLAPGINSLTLNSNHAAIVARVGEPYPIITGSDYVYDQDGNKVVNEDGFYLKTDEDQKIGEVTPDWRAGISNDFRYKNWSLHTLIDVKMGGDLFSLTHFWGKNAGILAETVGVNDLGNPKRDDAFQYFYDENYWDRRTLVRDDNGNPVLADNPGGVILDGVVATAYDENGNVIASTPNNQRVEYKDAASDSNNPHAGSVFDASYVKLREVALEYKFSPKVCKKLRLTNLSLSVVGRNLAIMHKNVDHIDPESTYSSGNVQGLDIGTMPTSRTYGFNLKLGF